MPSTLPTHSLLANLESTRISKPKGPPCPPAMSSPHDSKTPERPPPAAAAQPIRRSFTLPARTANKPRPAPAPAASADGIETLFVCASTKIVSFTASGPGRPVSPSRRRHTSGPEDASQPIPWRTAAERTLAVGQSPMRADMLQMLTRLQVSCGYIA
jgi:hypothetical protein